MNTAGLSVAGAASPGFYLDQPFNSFVTVENLVAFCSCRRLGMTFK
jgi:hypothetical protein